MKKLLLVSLLLGGLGLTTAPGCIVRTHNHSRHGHVHRDPPRHHHHHRARRHRNCGPSHYWDGYQCRHKGRGHGARKHDH